jgi:hypothetical protein
MCIVSNPSTDDLGQSISLSGVKDRFVHTKIWIRQLFKENRGYQQYRFYEFVPLGRFIANDIPMTTTAVAPIVGFNRVTLHATTRELLAALIQERGSVSAVLDLGFRIVAAGNDDLVHIEGEMLPIIYKEGEKVVLDRVPRNPGSWDRSHVFFTRLQGS